LQSESANQRSRATIAVAGIFARRREALDEGMLRRQMAHRIGGTRITRKKEGLAPAPTEILITPDT